MHLKGFGLRKNAAPKRHVRFYPVLSTRQNIETQNRKHNEVWQSRNNMLLLVSDAEKGDSASSNDTCLHWYCLVDTMTVQLEKQLEMLRCSLLAIFGHTNEMYERVCRSTYGVVIKR